MRTTTILAEKVLDHGSLQLVEAWGSEEQIIEAARMSTGKGFNGWGISHEFQFHDGSDACGYCTDPCYNSTTADPSYCRLPREAHKPGDEKLLRYLWENKHATPFEMAGATIEVKAPIFVFREWHRHRVPFGYNEMSARYTPLPNENYIPSVERLLIGSDGRNRQAGTVAGAAALAEGDAEMYREMLGEMYRAQEDLYQNALAAGVPKELARIHLPVARYSRMRATGNLRGWLAFLALRSTAKNPNAQWEIRQYADALWGLLAKVFPRTLALFGEEPKHFAEQRAFLRSLAAREDLPPDIAAALRVVFGAGS